MRWRFMRVSFNKRGPGAPNRGLSIPILSKGAPEQCKDGSLCRSAFYRTEIFAGPFFGFFVSLGECKP